MQDSLIQVQDVSHYNDRNFTLNPHVIALYIGIYIRIIIFIL